MRSQALACQRELGIDNAKLNVNGGAIAIGHPLGCSGARLATTLIHQMARTGASRGIASLCVGVGKAWRRSSNGNEIGNGPDGLLVRAPGACATHPTCPNRYCLSLNSPGFRHGAFRSARLTSHLGIFKVETMFAESMTSTYHAKRRHGSCYSKIESKTRIGLRVWRRVRRTACAASRRSVSRATDERPSSNQGRFERNSIAASFASMLSIPEPERGNSLSDLAIVKKR